MKNHIEPWQEDYAFLARFAPEQLQFEANDNAKNEQDDFIHLAIEFFAFAAASVFLWGLWICL